MASAGVLREAARPVSTSDITPPSSFSRQLRRRTSKSFSVQFEVGGSTGDEQYTHGDSDELLLVQSGSVKLELGEDVFLLEKEIPSSFAAAFRIAL